MGRYRKSAPRPTGGSGPSWLDVVYTAPRQVGEGGEVPLLRHCAALEAAQWRVDSLALFRDRTKADNRAPESCRVLPCTAKRRKGRFLLRGATDQAAALASESFRSRFHSRGVSSQTSRAGWIETRSMTSGCRWHRRRPWHFGKHRRVAGWYAVGRRGHRFTGTAENLPPPRQRAQWNPALLPKLPQRQSAPLPVRQPAAHLPRLWRYRRPQSPH